MGVLVFFWLVLIVFIMSFDMEIVVVLELVLLKIFIMNVVVFGFRL